MFVELHLIQNFAPSNLNRDSNGVPKACTFGGYKRARISSQALKRAIRLDAGFEAFLAGKGGFRTRRLLNVN
jgi:CRISPR system Cascade subunit CasC